MVLNPESRNGFVKHFFLSNFISLFDFARGAFCKGFVNMSSLANFPLWNMFANGGRSSRLNFKCIYNYVWLSQFVLARSALACAAWSFDLTDVIWVSFRLVRGSSKGVWPMPFPFEFPYVPSTRRKLKKRTQVVRWQDSKTNINIK